MPDIVKGRYNKKWVCNVLETILPGWVSKMTKHAKTERRFYCNNLTALSTEYKITPDFMRLIAEATPIEDKKRGKLGRALSNLNR